MKPGVFLAIFSSFFILATAMPEFNCLHGLLARILFGPERRQPREPRNNYYHASIYSHNGRPLDVRDALAFQRNKTRVQNKTPVQNKTYLRNRTTPRYKVNSTMYNITQLYNTTRRLAKINKSSIEEFSFSDIAKVADGVRKGAEIVSGIAGTLGGKSLEELDFLALEAFEAEALEAFDAEALEAFDAEALEEFNFGDIAKIADAVGKGAQIVSDIANVLNNK